MPENISIGGNWYPPDACIKLANGEWMLKKDLEAKIKAKEEAKPELDITGDGKVDEKDASLAGKVLSASKKRGRKKKTVEE